MAVISCASAGAVGAVELPLDWPLPGLLAVCARGLICAAVAAAALAHAEECVHGRAAS